MGSQINKHQRTFAKFYENQNRQKIDKKIIFKIEIDKKLNSRFESAILIKQIRQQQKIADFWIPRQKFADSGDLGVLPAFAKEFFVSWLVVTYLLVEILVGDVAFGAIKVLEGALKMNSSQIWSPAQIEELKGEGPCLCNQDPHREIVLIKLFPLICGMPANPHGWRDIEFFGLAISPHLLGQPTKQKRI